MRLGRAKDQFKEEVVAERSLGTIHIVKYGKSVKSYLHGLSFAIGCIVSYRVSNNLTHVEEIGWW